MPLKTLKTEKTYLLACCIVLIAATGGHQRLIAGAVTAGKTMLLKFRASQQRRLFFEGHAELRLNLGIALHRV